MKFRVLIIIWFMIIPLADISQYDSSSLYREMDTLKRMFPCTDGKACVDIMNHLAYLYAPVNFDSSIHYSSEAMRIATINGYSYGIAWSGLNTGNAYYYRMDFKNALVSYLSAFNIMEAYKPSEKLGELYMQMGNINYYTGRMDKAIASYKLAIDQFGACGHDEMICEGYFAIAFTFYWLEQKDSSILYSNHLLDLSRSLKDRPGEALAYDNIGQAILVASASEEEKKTSLPYLEKSLRIGEELQDEGLICINHINFGGYYDRSTKYVNETIDLSLARLHYESALKAAEKLSNHYLIAMCLNYLAAIELEEHNFSKALRRLEMSEKHLDTFFINIQDYSTFIPYKTYGKIIDYIFAQREKVTMNQLRYRLAMAQGKNQEAIEYIKRFYESRDSMYAEQQGKQFELLIAEAESSAADQKIRALAQENELNRLKVNQNRLIFAGIASIVIIISFVLLFYFQRKRLSAEQKSILNEQRLLRAQMNPHFLFNSLASIQNYIINEDSDKASIYLSRFSQLVRNILDNSVEEYVPLEKEIETVRNYLELQKVRYAGKFDFTINIDDKIDEENTIVPPMLAQPFIENAIEHGIRHRETPGRIDIRFRLEEGMIHFEVEDDGVGRDRAREIEKKQGKKHRSMSTSITIDRLAALNKKLKKKIRMEIADLKDDSGAGIGTRVGFWIPIPIAGC